MAEKPVERVPGGRGVLEHQVGLVGLGPGNPVVVPGRRVDVVLAVALLAGLPSQNNKSIAATTAKLSLHITTCS